MKKGITSYFGYHQPMEENIKQIKKAGFDRVMCATDPKYEKFNGTLESQVELIKKYGLELASLHARYDEDIAEEFWNEGEVGEKITEDFIEDIKLCNKFNFTCLVMHIYGKPSTIGDKRFERLIAEAKKYNVILAVENLIDLTPFYHLLTKYTDDNVKVCLDIGHINCFSRGDDIYKTFGNRIITTHLHDNDGLRDLHTTTLLAKSNPTPKYPDAELYQHDIQFVNWNDFIDCFVKNNLDLCLDYELNNSIQCQNIPSTTMLNQCFKEACELEQKILSLKK